MFNLKQEESQNTSKYPEYQKPGVHDNIVVTAVVLGKSQIKQTPYILLETKGQNGEVGKSNKMYLSTTPSEGKTMAAWNMTSKNILDLIVATHNISRDEAESIELVPNNIESIEEQYQMLSNKVSELLVGKPFRGKFKGVQTKENGPVYSTLDKVESMNVPRSATGLRFNESLDIELFRSVEATPSVF